jgi:molecular chaperone GrpE
MAREERADKDKELIRTDPDAAAAGTEPVPDTVAEVPESAEAEGDKEELSVADLAQKLTEATRAAEENRERYVRALADLDNLRRRTRQEREELIRFAGERVISALLPVIDNLDRANQAARETADLEALRQGLEMIGRQLGDILAAEGLKPIEAVGREFDPVYHEAVGQQESADAPDNAVVQEYRKGYMLHDKVVRPAMVVVNRKSGGNGKNN